VTDDLVIGLDSSTQSTKAIAWTPEGEAAAEGRAPLPFSSPRPGWAEQDPRDWWAAARRAIGEVVAQVGAERIKAVAISNQRETCAFLDAGGEAVRPAILWLDERGRSELPRLDAAIGAERMHRITGKPFDLTPVVSRLAWIARHEPEALARSAQVLDVHAYLTQRLTGRATASWTSADPWGIFDIAERRWSAPILAEVGVAEAQLPFVARPGTRAGGMTAGAAAATGLAEGTPVVVAGGDGQCAGLGVNAVRKGAVYLNLGTALITGMWSEHPRTSVYWRTMTSPTGSGYFLEGVQRAGAFLLNWLIDGFAGGRADPGAFARLDAAAAAIPLGSEGVTMSPYLSGCMDPHWDPDARAAILGLGPHHGAAHVYRAALEALTLESARALAAMRAEGLGPVRILAVGGGANNALWTGMFADATGLPVTRCHSPEASSLGAGISAAVGIGWHPDFKAAAAAMTREMDTVRPDPSRAEAWAALSRRQEQVYRRGFPA
jgi:xylulokinase